MVNQAAEFKKLHTTCVAITQAKGMPIADITPIYSQSLASGEGLYDALVEIFGNTAHIIHPELCSISSPIDPNDDKAKQGAINYAKTIAGFKRLDDTLACGIINKDGPELTKPIIAPLNTISAEVDEHTTGHTVSGNHWTLLIILPKTYTSPSGKKIVKANYQAFFVDSQGLKHGWPSTRLPPALQGALISPDGNLSFIHKFTAYSGLIPNDFTHIVNFGFTRDHSQINYIQASSSQMKQQIGNNDCGFWVIYNSIRITEEGGLTYSNAFPVDNTDINYNAKVSTAIGAQLRGFLPKLGFQVEESKPLSEEELLKQLGFDHSSKKKPTNKRYNQATSLVRRESKAATAATGALRPSKRDYALVYYFKSGDYNGPKAEDYYRLGEYMLEAAIILLKEKMSASSIDLATFKRCQEKIAQLQKQKPILQQNIQQVWTLEPSDLKHEKGVFSIDGKWFDEEPQGNTPVKEKFRKNDKAAFAQVLNSVNFAINTLIEAANFPKTEENLKSTRDQLRQRWKQLVDESDRPTMISSFPLYFEWNKNLGKEVQRMQATKRFVHIHVPQGAYTQKQHWQRDEKKAIAKLKLIATDDNSPTLTLIKTKCHELSIDLSLIVNLDSTTDLAEYLSLIVSYIFQHTTWSLEKQQKNAFALLDAVANQLLAEDRTPEEYTHPSTVRCYPGLANFRQTSLRDSSGDTFFQAFESTSMPPIEVNKNVTRSLQRQAMTNNNFEQLLIAAADTQLTKLEAPVTITGFTQTNPLIVNLRINSLLSPLLGEQFSRSFYRFIKKDEEKQPSAPHEDEHRQLLESVIAMGCKQDTVFLVETKFGHCHIKPNISHVNFTVYDGKTALMSEFSHLQDYLNARGEYEFIQTTEIQILNCTKKISNNDCKTWPELKELQFHFQPLSTNEGLKGLSKQIEAAKAKLNTAYQNLDENLRRYELLQCEFALAFPEEEKNLDAIFKEIKDQKEKKSLPSEERDELFKEFEAINKEKADIRTNKLKAFYEKIKKTRKTTSGITTEDFKKSKPYSKYEPYLIRYLAIRKAYLDNLMAGASSVKSLQKELSSLYEKYLTKRSQLIASNEKPLGIINILRQVLALTEKENKDKTAIANYRRLFDLLPLYFSIAQLFKLTTKEIYRFWLQAYDLILHNKLLNYHISWFCKSGEDRTGLAEIFVLSMFIFHHQFKRFPLWGKDHDDRKLFNNILNHVYEYSLVRETCDANAPGARALQISSEPGGVWFAPHDFDTPLAKKAKDMWNKVQLSKIDRPGLNPALLNLSLQEFFYQSRIILTPRQILAINNLTKKAGTLQFEDILNILNPFQKDLLPESIEVADIIEIENENFYLYLLQSITEKLIIGEIKLVIDMATQLIKSGNSQKNFAAKANVLLQLLKPYAADSKDFTSDNLELSLTPQQQSYLKMKLATEQSDPNASRLLALLNQRMIAYHWQELQHPSLETNMLIKLIENRSNRVGSQEELLNDCKTVLSIITNKVNSTNELGLVELLRNSNRIIAQDKNIDATLMELQYHLEELRKKKIGEGKFTKRHPNTILILHTSEELTSKFYIPFDNNDEQMKKNIIQAISELISQAHELTRAEFVPPTDKLIQDVATKPLEDEKLAIATVYDLNANDDFIAPTESNQKSPLKLLEEKYLGMVDDCLRMLAQQFSSTEIAAFGSGSPFNNPSQPRKKSIGSKNKVSLPKEGDEEEETETKKLIEQAESDYTEFPRLKKKDNCILQ